MICKPCGEAGDLSASMVDHPHYKDHVDLVGIALVRVVELHDQCRGGTWCDCQHKIPDELSCGCPKQINGGFPYLHLDHCPMKGQLQLNRLLLERVTGK